MSLKRLSPIILPFATISCIFLAWAVLAAAHVYPSYAFPSPHAVGDAFLEEIRAGRLPNDIEASIYRVIIGFILAVAVALPLGLWMGMNLIARYALEPIINFFRALSPIAWIPFAILWFRIGDPAAIFLIFLAAVFPLTLAVVAAVANVPSVLFRVGADYGYTGIRMLTHVTLPAIVPQLTTALRINAGLAWVVLVAAEMVGCQSGLGYGIYDARNAERTDVVVAYMIVTGSLGMLIDWIIKRFTLFPSVRWGYDR